MESFFLIPDSWCYPVEAPLPTAPPQKEEMSSVTEKKRDSFED